MNPFLEEKCDQLFGDSYATGKNIYTPSAEPSQPFVLENYEGNESTKDNGNAAEDNTGVYNFQNNPYI